MQRTNKNTITQAIGRGAEVCYGIPGAHRLGRSFGMLMVRETTSVVSSAALAVATITQQPHDMKAVDTSPAENIATGMGAVR